MARACLAKISPFDPTTGLRTTIYVTSHDDRRVTGLNGQVWEPALSKAPALSMQLWNGDFQNAVDPGQASFAINMNGLAQTFAEANRYVWMGAPVEIYAEEPGTAWPWTVRFKGLVRSYSRKKQTLSLAAEVNVEPFDKNILTAVYAGTSGAEGGSDLKNRPKPLVIGHAKNVEPVLINAVDSVYQFSAYGAIEAVEYLFERGSEFPPSSGDYANYAALVAASIAPGHWATCLAAGMIRLGAPAYGVITGDIRGHKVGGTTPRLTGAVINALAAIAGVSGADILTSTLSAMDAAIPYPINLVLTAQTTFLSMARSLALACNHQAGVSLEGKFFAARVTMSGTEALTLHAQGRALPEVVEADELDVSVPYWKTTLSAARCWRVHSTDEISSADPIIDRGRYDPDTVYRAGNIVDLADGSRWIYINDIPTAGNDPPDALFWDQLSGPISGANALTGLLTNEAHALAANASGVPINYDGAGSQFLVFDGGTDVSASFTLSVQDNPEALTVTFDGMSFAVTGGLDAGESGATLTIRATGSGAYSGKTVDKVFSLSKVAGGASAKIIRLVPDRFTIYYGNDGEPAPEVQTTTFSVEKQNTTATVVWSLTDLTGAPRTPTNAFLSASTGDTVTMTEPQFAAAANNTGGVIVTAAVFDGTSITDRTSVIRVAAGANGINNGSILIYRRAAASPTPAVPSVDATYNFTTGNISGLNNGWNTTPPANNGLPLWVTRAAAAAGESTDIIEPHEWATPVIQVQDGSDGAAGLNQATVFLYQRAAGTPTKPSTTSTYTFSTGTITGFNNGWSASVPAANGNPLYVTRASAISSAATDLIFGSEWSTPSIMAADGSDGAPGQATNVIWRKSATQPTTPSPSAGVPSGWYETSNALPAGADPIWVSYGVKASGSSTFTWQTPVATAAADLRLWEGLDANGKVNAEKVETPALANNSATSISSFFKSYVTTIGAANSWVNVTDGVDTAAISVATGPKTAQKIFIDVHMGVRRAGGGNDNLQFRLRRNDGTILPQVYAVEATNDKALMGFAFLDSNPGANLTRVYQLQMLSDDSATPIYEVFMKSLLGKTG